MTSNCSDAVRAGGNQNSTDNLSLTTKANGEASLPSFSNNMSIVVTQTFNPAVTLPSPPLLRRRLSIKPDMSERFRSPSPGLKRHEEEEKKSPPPELNSLRYQSRLSGSLNSSNSSNVLGANLRCQTELQENALKKMSIQSLASILDSDSFEKHAILKDKIKTVGLNDFKFMDNKLGDFLLRRAIGPELVLCVNCFDVQGNVLAHGLGVFDEFEINRFFKAQGDKKEKSKIKEFLDYAFNTHTPIYVFMGGMHSIKNYEALEFEIKKYHPTQFIVQINPYLIPENFKERDDQELLDEYINCELRCTLKIINKEGRILLAGESLDAGKDYVKFKERDFEAWKSSLQNLKKTKEHRDHHYKVMRLTETIYRNREFYGKINKVMMLQALCYENNLTLEDIFNDPKALKYFLKSGRLRKVLYFYIQSKLANTPSTFYGLYFDTKKKILEVSAEKLMRELNDRPNLPPKAIKKTFENLFPGTFSDLFAIDSVILWLHSESGKAAAAALKYYHAAEPVEI